MHLGSREITPLVFSGVVVQLGGHRLGKPETRVRLPPIPPRRRTKVVAALGKGVRRGSIPLVGSARVQDDGRRRAFQALKCRFESVLPLRKSQASRRSGPRSPASAAPGSIPAACSVRARSPARIAVCKTAREGSTPSELSHAPVSLVARWSAPQAEGTGSNPVGSAKSYRSGKKDVPRRAATPVFSRSVKMSSPVDPVPGLRNRVARVRFLPGTPADRGIHRKSRKGLDQFRRGEEGPIDRARALAPQTEP